MKRNRFAIILGCGVLGLGSVGAVAAAAADSDEHTDPENVPEATVPVKEPDSILVDGTDADGNPISIQVDDLRGWKDRAQAMSDELLSDEPPGVYYTFVTDENGDPKPYQRCIAGAGDDELKAQMLQGGWTEEMVAQIPACTMVE